MNEVVRLTKIGRMYKMVKLTKLLRLMKIIKNKSAIMQQVEQTMKIGVGLQRLIFFFAFFLIFIHIVSCLWVMTAQIEDNYKGTWMEKDVNGV